MNMTDEELDRDWKPNGRRPQSTIARSFSQELMDIFRIENSVADLDEQVEKRKKEINTRASELEALEARIREMEERLKGQKPGDAAAAAASGALVQAPETAPPAIPERDRKYGSGSRPGTARQQQQAAVPGQMPPTPVASEDGDRERDA